MKLFDKSVGTLLIDSKNFDSIVFLPNMDISVTFPQELLIAARETPETFSRKVMIYTLGHLYEQGKISSGIAASILGSNRWEFYKQLSEHGFSVIDLDVEELEAEAITSREIATQNKSS